MSSHDTLCAELRAWARHFEEWVRIYTKAKHTRILNAAATRIEADWKWIEGLEAHVEDLKRQVIELGGTPE